MPDSTLAQLRRRLLLGGLPAWQVGRAIAELDTHLQDLEDEALAAGLSPELAKRDALDRIGAPVDLAEQYLQHTLLRPRTRLLVAGANQVLIALDEPLPYSAELVRWTIALLAAAVFTLGLLSMLRFLIYLH